MFIKAGPLVIQTRRLQRCLNCDKALPLIERGRFKSLRCEPCARLWKLRAERDRRRVKRGVARCLTCSAPLTRVWRSKRVRCPVPCARDWRLLSMRKRIAARRAEMRALSLAGG